MILTVTKFIGYTNKHKNYIVREEPTMRELCRMDRHLEAYELVKVRLVNTYGVKGSNEDEIEHFATYEVTLKPREYRSHAPNREITLTAIGMAVN